MGAQNGPIDGPSMGHRWAMAKRSADHRWAIDGNAMVHRWPMDGLPWDPNSGRKREWELGIRLHTSSLLGQNSFRTMCLIPPGTPCCEFPPTRKHVLFLNKNLSLVKEYYMNVNT